MPIDDSELLTDRAYLTGVQYRTEKNLAARQLVYAYQQPKIDLAATVIDLAALGGAETVAEIGCGNGIYLAELTRRGHAGRLLGADLSPGMLAVARSGAPTAGLLVGDAAALPLADGVSGVTLAAHMLYHVPDRRAAVREFRRITRPGGLLLVVLNGADHLRELRALVHTAAPDAGLRAEAAWVWSDSGQAGPGLDLDAGAELLAGPFGTVERHDFTSELAIPAAQPVLDYVRSLRVTQSLSDPDLLVAAVASRLSGEVFRVRTHCGLLICR